MKEFIQNAKNWALANKPLTLVIVGACAVMLIAVIGLLATAGKAKKSNKSNKRTQTTVTLATPTATPVQQPTVDKVAEEKAARLAVLERLEQERLAAEREEQERLAKEKAELERLEQERLAKEKAATKATQPKVSATKTAKKPVQPSKEEKPATRITGTSTAPKATPTEKAPSKKYSGKWTIFKVTTDNPDDEETFFFELRASNGEKLLSSEEYASYSGVLKGIETHKANIEKGNFRITLSKKGDYIFKLLSGKNMLLCMGEKYPTRARCESAIESTKRFATTAIIDEKVQEQVIKVPVDEEALELLADGYNGKWIINSAENEGDKVFFFELFANNGEKLLSSEEYTTYIGAVNGIQTHKTNIEKGNFRISLTKRGDYIYKLLNGNGQLLCLGEHYKTKSRCQSAVESVKRFAKNSPVLTDPEHTK